jgi:hypothetical protein
MQTKSSPLSLSIQKFSYRFAEQVLNSKPATKEEIEEVLLETIPDITKLSRPAFNKLLLERFLSRGWKSQPAVFDDPADLRGHHQQLSKGNEVGVFTELGRLFNI